MRLYDKSINTHEIIEDPNCEIEKVNPQTSVIKESVPLNKKLITDHQNLESNAKSIKSNQDKSDQFARSARQKSDTDYKKNYKAAEYRNPTTENEVGNSLCLEKIISPTASDLQNTFKSHKT